MASRLSDDHPNFKMLLTIPKKLLVQIDALYPKPRYPSRSRVIVMILEQYMNHAVVEPPKLEKKRRE